MRIGLIGDESTHAQALATWCSRHPDAGVEVAALVAPTRGWDVPAVASASDLVGRVDCAALFTRDASTHTRDALPLLMAGLRVFIDKPVTTNLTGLATLIANAKVAGGSFTSFSALRLQSATRTAVSVIGEHGGAMSVAVTGPADPNDPHGWASYGVHSVELALALAGGPLSELRVVRTGNDKLHIAARCERVAVDIDLSPHAPFSLKVATVSGKTLNLAIPLDTNYYDPAAAAIVAFLTTGHSLVPDEQLADIARAVEVIGWLPAPHRNPCMNPAGPADSSHFRHRAVT